MGRIFAKRKNKGIFSFKKFRFSVHIMSAQEVSLRAEEDKLKARYGGIEKARNKMLLKKIKSGGNKQFFDSGDYGMEKGQKSPFGKSVSPQSKHCMLYKKIFFCIIRNMKFSTS